MKAVTFSKEQYFKMPRLSLENGGFAQKSWLGTKKYNTMVLSEVVMPIKPLEAVSLINDEYSIDVLNYFETYHEGIDISSEFQYQSNNIMSVYFGLYNSGKYIHFEIDIFSKEVTLVEERGLFPALLGNN